jgi:hypothetical protein
MWHQQGSRWRQPKNAALHRCGFREGCAFGSAPACIGATNHDRHQIEHDAVLRDVVAGGQCLSVIFIFGATLANTATSTSPLIMIDGAKFVPSVITGRVFDPIEYLFQ